MESKTPGRTSLDLIGQTFGRLTVLGPAGKIGRSKAWRCRCECGNETVVRAASLRAGLTRSCGCLNRDASRAKRLDLTGQEFGRLTVVEPAEDTDGCAMWRCRCECGNEIAVRGDYLRSGHVMSCGCMRRETPKGKLDLTGQAFGDLTVLGPAEKIGRFTAWRCRCTCGNEAVVKTVRLRAGYATSCGCKGTSHSRRKLDLTGQRYGYLTVLEPAGNSNGRTAWRCRCDCGRETVVRTGHLRDGSTKSCGCRNGRGPDLAGRDL